MTIIMLMTMIMTMLLTMMAMMTVIVLGVGDDGASSGRRWSAHDDNTVHDDGRMANDEVRSGRIWSAAHADDASDCDAGDNDDDVDNNEDDEDDN